MILSFDKLDTNLRGKNTLKTKVSEFNVGIFYYCEKGTENCELKEEDEADYHFNIFIAYNGFLIYHQNESEPLQKKIYILVIFTHFYLNIL